MDENSPYDSPQQFSAEPSAPGDPAVLQKVKPPAIGLVVVGIINVLLAIVSLGGSVLGMMGMNQAMQQQQEQMEQLQEQGMDPNMARYFELMMSVQGPLGIVLNGIALAVGVVIILGALKMMKLESYGFSLTASILAMIPCLSSCCIIGLPIGIWAIVVLSSVDVKNAFNRGTAL